MAETKKTKKATASKTTTAPKEKIAVTIETPASIMPSEARMQVLERQLRRKRWTIASYILFVLIPFIACAYYFIGIAADRYAVESKFAIRSASSQASPDILGLVTGATSSVSTTLDSYIVTDFIESRDLVNKLESRIDLRSFYDNDHADFVMRFDRSKSTEDFVKYLTRMIKVNFDTSSQIITLEAQAFTPEDAEKLSGEIVQLSGSLINDISEQSRFDTVNRAQQEVLRAEELLRKDRAALAKLREEQRDIDPQASVVSQQALLGGLESDLLRKRSQRGTLLEFVDSDAPQIQLLNSQIAALEAQLEAKKSIISSSENDTSGSQSSLTERIGAFEELAVDLEFRERAYVSALSSLEAARLESDRQQRYLAVVVPPSTPQKSIYPKRGLSIIISFILLSVTWAISVMLFYIIREHLN